MDKDHKVEWLEAYLKSRLADTHVYYVPFFDFRDAMFGMISTVHNLLIYRTKNP